VILYSYSIRYGYPARLRLDDARFFRGFDCALVLALALFRLARRGSRVAASNSANVL
jgi:hypothetical protein